MADISQVKINGTVYNIKDNVARQGGLVFHLATDASNTPYGVTWKNAQQQTITGELPAWSGTSQSGNPQTGIYLVKSSNSITGDTYDEYVAVSTATPPTQATTSWERLGNTEIIFENLGQFAYADTGTGTATVTDYVTGASFGSGTASVSGTHKPTGSVSSTFVGNALESTGSATPQGTVSTPTITVNPTVTTGGASKQTKNGSVTAGTAPSFSQGTFNGGSFTQGNDSFVAPTWEASVTDEVLEFDFTAGSFTQGTDVYTKPTHGSDTFTAGTTPSTVVLPTFTSVDIVTGITSATASQPTFTGSAMDITVSGTPTGDVTSTFTGNSDAVSLTGTATGTVTLTKGNKTITSSVTPIPKNS